MGLLDDRILMLNEFSLNRFYAEEQVAAENIVNSSTAGYKRKYVDASLGFLEEIEDAEELLEGRRKGKLDFSIEVEQEEGLKMQQDENSVDRDIESINMTKANFGYKCAEICLNSRFAMLSTVINSK